MGNLPERFCQHGDDAVIGQKEIVLGTKLRVVMAMVMMMMAMMTMMMMILILMMMVTVVAVCVNGCRQPNAHLPLGAVLVVVFPQFGQPHHLRDRAARHTHTMDVVMTTAVIELATAVVMMQLNTHAPPPLAPIWLTPSLPPRTPCNVALELFLA